MAKIVFNIAYFSPIVISRCWAQEETKRETTEINMGEKQEKRGGGGPVIWRRKGGIFIVIPVLVLSLFVIIVLSRSLLPPPALCRVVSQIMQPSLLPSLFFYEFAVKIYDSPLSIDLRAEHAYDDGYNNRLSKNK